MILALYISTIILLRGIAETTKLAFGFRGRWDTTICLFMHFKCRCLKIRCALSLASLGDVKTEMFYDTVFYLPVVS